MSFADDDLPLMLRKCLVSGCLEQFSGENILEEWLGHLYTHLEQDYAQVFKALEGNSEFLGWSSRPDTGVIQKVAGKWTLCKCLCETLEDSGIVLPLPLESPLPMDCSEYVFSRPSLVKDEVFSRKSIPTAGTDSVPSCSNNEDFRNEVEQVSPSELLNEFVHFTLSWFSAWLASQPGNTELNPGSQSIPRPNGGSQGESSQRRKRKARGQNDNNRGERKARRTGRSNEDEPDGDGSGGPCAAESSQPDFDAKDLACPFYKRNPSNYGHRKFELCATGGWKTYHRVREHLNRKHLRPSYLCERCFADFKDDTSLQRHTMSSCSANRDIPYLRPTQWEQLKAANMRGKPEAEKWKDMYRLLFPGEDVPDPYKNALSSNEHVMRLRSAIECIILNTPNATQNLLRTIRSIMSVTIQAMDGISDTAGEFTPRGSHSPEEGMASPPTIGVSHGATPDRYPHYSGNQIPGPSQMATHSHGADMYVAAANDIIETWGPLEACDPFGEVADTTGFVNDQTGVLLFDVLGGFLDPIGFVDDQNVSAALNESQAVSYTASFTEDQNDLPTFDGLGGTTDTTAFEDHQNESGAFSGSQAVTYMASLTEGQNDFGTLDGLGENADTAAFMDHQSAFGGSEGFWTS